MPRQPRFVLPDLAVHIVQRGHNRAPCFVSPRDYELYLLHPRELAAKFQCAMHAYCLMPNHVHMLMTPPSRDACGRYMRQLGQRYVQYFNRRYRRTGSLWEGRFKSCIVDTARYVLACYRYIEMNPVQPALVVRPQDYQWSSFTINAGHPEYLARLGRAGSLMRIPCIVRAAGRGFAAGRDPRSDQCRPPAWRGRSLGSVPGQGLRMRSSRALPMAWVRLTTLSLRRIFWTWFLTVRGLILRIAPISKLLLPR
jgi:REP element-mobilizing transposase RayT